MNLEKRIYAEYTKNGQSSAFDLANKNNVPYEYCKACESESPSIKHICCICGQSTSPLKKHTQGEWTINDHFPKDNKKYISNGETVIAYIAKNPSVSIDDEAESNAKLIAAAPELLEALMEIVQLKESASSTEELFPLLQYITNHIKPVIKKATDLNP